MLTLPFPRIFIRPALAGCVLAAGMVLTACGGNTPSNASTNGGSGSAGSGSSSTTTDKIPPIPGETSAVSKLTIKLPTGVAITPDKLNVVTSAAGAVPGADGTVSVTAYTSGSQFIMVLSPAGNPMLFGWVNATRTVIDAETTAEALAYFALQGPLVLKSADAEALIAALPEAAGMSAVADALSTELKANVDAFAGPNTNVTKALLDFMTATIAAAKAPPAGSLSHAAAALRSHIHAITITPDAQSGITVLQDPPFSAHLSNAFRRRSYAYVQRVSHTIAGVVTDDPASVTSFEVEPVKGVTGGVFGTITDIYAAYWGLQPTAYGPSTAPSDAPGTFGLPLLDGTDATTYKVIVVGPGATAGTVALTDAQVAEQTEISIRSCMLDYLMPMITNVILGSGGIDFKSGQATAGAQFIADYAANATTDWLAFIQSNTDNVVRDKLRKGQFFDATVDILGTVASANTLRTILEHAFNLTISQAAAGTSTLDFRAARSYIVAFSNVLNLTGAVLQQFDAGVFLLDMAHSDDSNEWTVTSTASKVNLNPSPANIIGLGSQVLTTAVLGADSLTGYSFHWTTTTNAGDLSNMAPGGLAHQTDFCSSSEKALFVVKPGTPQFAHDTVTVEAYNGANCGGTASPNYVGTATTLATYVPQDAITFSPAAVDAMASQVTSFTASLTTPITDATLVLNYHWAISGNGGGSLADPKTGAPSQAFDTTNTTATYTAPATVATGSQDIITVTLTVTLPWEDNLSFVTAKGSAFVNYGGPLAISVSPQNPQVPQGTLQNFTVAATSGAFPSGATFKWVLTGGLDLYGDPRDLGGSGGGTIGVGISVPPSSGASTGTGVTVVTANPTITFAANPFGPEADGPDFSWIDELNLAVTVQDAGGNVLQTASTLIGTQLPRDILLP